MSLVAYGSSDEESDTSDSEEVKNSGVSQNTMTSDRGDDTEKLKFTEEAKELLKQKGLVLPLPKQANVNSDSAGRKTGWSSFLPKPKNINNLERESERGQDVSPEEKPPLSFDTVAEDADEILEIEEDYEPIAKRTKKPQSSEVDEKPKSVGSLFSLLPAPWQTENTWQKGVGLKKRTDRKESGGKEKRSKQPIKIAIPTALKTDSDEEDDEPAKKALAPSKGGSGLKSLLPKPKHSITLKADNPNKPTVKLASRPLIPHTLTKKATAAEKIPLKTEKKKQAEDAISDEEDEPVSFFTFSEKSEGMVHDEKMETSPSSVTESSTGVKLHVHKPSLDIRNLPVGSSVVHGEIPSSTSTSQSGKEYVTEIAPSQVMEEPNIQTATGHEETFSTGDLETRTYYYEQEPEQSQHYVGSSDNGYENYTSYYNTSSSNISQPYYSQEPETYTYSYPTATLAQTQNQNQETDIDLEKLQKLKGRRNRHEEINIVDVNAEDQIGNCAEMVAKYGTEEIVHRPSRKKKDMPTAQQRRKHQITYLAFQAKERELELRQQWSANRQTRRQTQSKYGF